MTNPRDEVDAERLREIRALRMASGAVCHALITSGQLTDYRVRDMKGVVNDLSRLEFSAQVQPWEKTNRHLGSLIQVSLIHAFASIAENHRFGSIHDAKAIGGSPKDEAIRLLHCYVEEYSRGTYESCQTDANRIYQEECEYLTPFFHKYRAAVEKLLARVLAGDIVDSASVVSLIDETV